MSCFSFIAATDTPFVASHASFVHNTGKAGTQYIKPTLLYAYAEMQGLAAFQHRKIQSQTIALINLQKRTQVLVDSTADLTVQLVLFKCYLDTAHKHEKALKVCLLLCVCCNLKLSLHFGMTMRRCCCSGLISGNQQLYNFFDCQYAAVPSKCESTPRSHASQAVYTMASSEHQSKSCFRFMPCLLVLCDNCHRYNWTRGTGQFCVRRQGRGPYRGSSPASNKRTPPCMHCMLHLGPSYRHIP